MALHLQGSSFSQLFLFVVIAVLYVNRLSLSVFFFVAFPHGSIEFRE
jgi:hypothetical protein